MSDASAVEVGRLYLPIKRIADVLTTSQHDVFVRLPGLQGYWPGSIRTSSGAVVDHSGGSGDVVQTGVCPTGYDGNPFLHIGDGTNFLYNSVVGQITGTETFVETTLRGFTVGGWFYIDESPSSGAGLVSRHGLTPQLGHALVWRSTDQPQMNISGTGANLLSASGVAASIGQWNFIVGRFIPSAEVAIFANGAKTTNVTAIPASINVSTQNFEIGRWQNANSRIPHARWRDIFICAAALSDELIEEVRATSAP